MQWSDAIKESISFAQSVTINEASKQKIWQLLDLTSLNDNDTESSIVLFLEKAYSPYGHVAAVCIYPEFVRMARAQFDKTPVKVATVANFPKGDTALTAVLTEISRALQVGAQEIDVVFPYQRYLAGQKEYAHTFVESCKAACGDDVKLKIILETGALSDLSAIAEASYIALSAGADFIKTSSGKIAQGATLEAASVMLLVIRDVLSKLKRPSGFKAAGGISEIKKAAQYVALADHIMGSDWTKPSTFRIGSSRLADELLR